jgi:beta-N-acetylglucosaminidase
MLSYAEIENFVKATKEITGGAKWVIPESMI